MSMMSMNSMQFMPQPGMAYPMHSQFQVAPTSVPMSNFPGAAWPAAPTHYQTAPAPAQSQGQIVAQQQQQIDILRRKMKAKEKELREEKIALEACEKERDALKKERDSLEKRRFSLSLMVEQLNGLPSPTVNAGKSKSVAHAGTASSAPTEDANKTAAEEHFKFATDKKVYDLQAGDLKHFYMGLDDFNGRPVGDNLEAQMRMEFCRPDIKWTAKNYNIITTGEQEWEFVVNPDKDRQYPGQSMPGGRPGSDKERRFTDLRKLMDLPRTKKAGLTRAEVIAVVLYTGPAFVLINGGLRKRGESLVHRTEMKDEDKFPVTCSVFNSAIIKLAKVTDMPESRLVYRGVHGVRFDKEQVKCRSFVEFGFSSATPDKDVALVYSKGSGRSDLCTLLEIEVGQIDKGANLADYSQFPGENEVCLPPLSNFELLGNGRVEKEREREICVFRVKLNINVKSKTVEELQAARREATVDFSRMLELEYTELLGGSCKTLQEVREKEVKKMAPQWFNNNAHFWSMQEKLFQLYREEMERETRLCELKAEGAATWQEKIKLLQQALALAPRITQGDPEKEALVRSAKVVEALPAVEKLSNEKEGDRRLAAEALIDHARRLVDSNKNMMSAKDIAKQVVKLLEGGTTPAIDSTLAMAHYLIARVLLKKWPEAKEDRDKTLEEEQIVSEAMKEANAAYTIFIAAYGKVHEDVPRVVSLLGQLYARQKRTADALKQHEEALTLRKTVFGEKHLEIAASLSNIADVQPKHALENLTEALKIQRHQLGTNHEYVSYTEEKLGKELRKLGRLEEAKTHFENAHRIFADKFGEDDGRTKNCMDAWAGVMDELVKKYGDEASGLSSKEWPHKVELLQKALDLTQRSKKPKADVLFKQDAVVAALPNNVAEVTDTTERKLAAGVLVEHATLLIDKHGNPADGVKAAERVVEMGASSGSKTGDLAEKVAGAHYLIARGQFKQKKWDEARPHAEEALKMWKEAKGTEVHDAVPRVLSLLGQILHKQGDTTEALNKHRRAELLRRVIFGEDHSEVAASLSNIADVQSELEQFDEARESLEKALAMQQKQWGKTHEYVGYTEEKLGKVLKQLGKFEEAAAHFKTGYDIFLKACGENATMTKSCYQAFNESKVTG